MKKHLIALQVYTVRDFAEQDFAGTMRKVKEMGYDGVELAGTYDMKAVEIKKILDEIGLELVSAHVNLNLIEDDAVLDDFIEFIASGETFEHGHEIGRMRRPGAQLESRSCALFPLIPIVHAQPPSFSPALRVRRSPYAVPQLPRGK